MPGTPPPGEHLVCSILMFFVVGSLFRFYGTKAVVVVEINQSIVLE